MPRQPNLCSVESTLVLDGEGITPECADGLTQHSHIWVLFLFHQNLSQGWKPKVRPPRLGGNDKIGVLATRSSFRPNGIGMSAVELKATRVEKGQLHIKVQGLDLVDGTPIVDIKPYIPYSDALPHASSGFAEQAPESALTLDYSGVTAWLQDNEANYPELRGILTQVLEADPRPSYKKSKTDDRIYGIKLYDLNIRWQVKEQTCHIVSIEALNANLINNEAGND